MAEDEKQADSLRGACAQAVGSLGRRDQVVENLLQLAEDEKQSGSLRRDCAEALGKLGEKNKAVEILIPLYLSQPDKYKWDARQIYVALWEFTGI